MSDSKFMTEIISLICNYAVANKMSPNETIKTIAENLLALLEISNFDGWKGEQKNDENRSRAD